MKTFGKLITAASIAFLTACGGGGGASTAELSADNVVDLAVAGTEAAKSSATSTEAFAFKSGQSSSFDSQAFAKQIAQDLYATQDLSSYLCSTGSYIINIPDSATQTSFTATATFTNCTISDSYSTVTINGTINISGTASSINISANLTITENGVSETVSFSGSCSYSNATVGACSYSSTFTGVDGRTYTSANMSVSGNYISGYTVSGSVTDPDHGVITISTQQPVTFNCTDGSPDSGQITITGNGSATVTFNDCNSFTVTYNGSSNTYNWASI